MNNLPSHIQDLEDTINAMVNNAGMDRLYSIELMAVGFQKTMKINAWDAECFRWCMNQLPEEIQNKIQPVKKIQFPEKNKPDGEGWVKCSKCGGNGLYIMSIVNGKPYSRTGNTCYKCNGKGWIKK